MITAVIASLVVLFFFMVSAIMFAGTPWYVGAAAAAMMALGLGGIWKWLDALPPEMRAGEGRKRILTTAEFEYLDAQGSVTRYIVDVHRIGPEYLEGYCHRQRENRVFKLDRIREAAERQGKPPVMQWLADAGKAAP
mgnify:CR=1 FL=1